MRLLRRAYRAARWRVNAVLGTGVTLPSSPAGTRYSAKAVSDYYDQFTQAYLDSTGPFLQAFRGRNTDDLMAYYVERCGIEDGMRILDAGCGVGAPAAWLAQRFPALKVEGLTNSRVQAEHAQLAIDDAGLGDRVSIQQGDYHDLSNLYPHAHFDRVLFIESLGHSENIHQVLYGVRDVLKPGELLYIKDFFQRRSLSSDLQKKIDHAVNIINGNYLYHVMQLPDLVAACMETGFTIDSISPPRIVPDLQLTVDFEHEAGRLTYPAFSRLHAVDWYDVIVRREGAVSPTPTSLR